MSELKIRCAQRSDVPRLREIYSFYAEHSAAALAWDVPDESAFCDKVAKILEQYPFAVAEADGTILGFAFADAFDSRASFEQTCSIWVYLAPESRGKGIGGQLCEMIEQEAEREGMINVIAAVPAATVLPDQYLPDDAAGFFAHRGYRECGRLPRCAFKFFRWYDIVYLHKTISSHRFPGIRIPFGKHTVTSGKDEEDIVSRGVADIRAALLSGDADLAESLLLHLQDRFDPYYQNLLPREDERAVCSAIEELIVQTRDAHLAEYALEVLEQSGVPTDFPILRRDFDRILKVMQRDVRWFLLRESLEYSIEQYFYKDRIMLVDLLPETVPTGSAGRYFDVADYYVNPPAYQMLAEKFTQFLLKLNCYYKYMLCTAAPLSDDAPEMTEAPLPEAIVQAVADCCKRDGFKHEAVLVLLPDADAMIELRNDNAYLVIHGGDDTLDRIAGQLAAAEGLFYYKSPVHPSLLEDQPTEA